VRRLPGIGKVTEPQLLSLGIATLGDLQQQGLEALRSRWGRWGEYLHAKSRGEDIDAYAYREEPKSISHETTFEQDTADIEEMQRTLSYLSQLVGGRLRDHGLFARTVGLKVRFAPFRTFTRDVTLDEPTHFDPVIFENVLRLLDHTLNPRQKVRLLGVRASNLERTAFQRNLLDARQGEKLDRLLEATDQVRRRYGFKAVQLARSLERGEKKQPEARSPKSQWRNPRKK
jgi:DNA polymerase-4